MENLKKRDIKKYRKECRKIKRDIREQQGLPVGIQILPPKTRTPEQIKAIKTEVFSKFQSKRQKVNAGDFKDMVDVTEQ